MTVRFYVAGMKKLNLFVGGALVVAALTLAGCNGSRDVGRGRDRWSDDAPRAAQEAGRGLRAADQRPAQAQLVRGPRASSQVVESGEAIALDGVLRSQDGEWVLETAEGRRYELHFGAEWYRDSTGIELEAGKAVTVRGTLEGDEISVVSATLDGRLYAFRGEDGRPLWSGGGRAQGRGRGAGAS